MVISFFHSGSLTALSPKCFRTSMLTLCFEILRKLKGVTPDALLPADAHPVAGVYCPDGSRQILQFTFCWLWCRYASFGKQVGCKRPCNDVIGACPLDRPSYSLFSIGINCTDAQERLALTPSEGMTQRCVSHAAERHHEGNMFLGSLVLATVPRILFAS